MRSFVVAIGLGASLLLFSGQADAQYKYTDDKGVSKVMQYKLDIPEPYRDAAVWVGPTGVGKPGLSKEAEQTKLRDDAYRRIGEAEAQLVPYKQAEAARAAAQREVDGANAAAAEARQAKKAAAAAAQRERREDARAEESLRLQREAVELQRQQAQTDQIRQSNEMYRQLYRGK
jgi:hypothetical protein